MSAQYTPGPWDWALLKGDYKELRAPSITASAIPEYVLAVEYDVSDYGLSVSTRIDVTEANARLIAAAPDLVEALQALLAHRHDDDPALSLEQVEDQARAALLKAGAPK